MNLQVHFTSQTCEWPTPQWLFDELDKEFHFETDVVLQAMMRNANDISHRKGFGLD